MLVHAEEINRTCVSGAWSFNSPNFQGGQGAVLTQIILEDDTDNSRSFKFTITNKGGQQVYPIGPTEPFIGFIRETVHIPLHGIYTIAVSECEDGLTDVFKGRLMIEESPK